MGGGERQDGRGVRRDAAAGRGKDAVMVAVDGGMEKGLRSLNGWEQMGGGAAGQGKPGRRWREEERGGGRRETARRCGPPAFAADPITLL